MGERQNKFVQRNLTPKMDPHGLTGMSQCHRAGTIDLLSICNCEITQALESDHLLLPALVINVRRNRQASCFMK